MGKRHNGRKAHVRTVNVKPADLAKVMAAYVVLNFPRADEEPVVSDALKLGRLYGFRPEYEFDWKRHWAKRGDEDGVIVRVRGQQVAIVLPSDKQLKPALSELYSENDAQMDAGVLPFMAKLLDLPSDIAADKFARFLAGIPTKDQFRILTILKRKVAFVNLLHREAGQGLIDADKLYKKTKKAYFEYRTEKFRQFYASAEKTRVDAYQALQAVEKILRNEFWGALWQNVYWEPAATPPLPPDEFLPDYKPAEEEEDDKADVEPKEDGPAAPPQPEDNQIPAEPILENEAEEPERRIEEAIEIVLGADIPEDDPRLATPRAEAWRFLGCKRFIEPPPEFSRNGYFAALMMTLEQGKHVVFMDTNKPKFAVYLIAIPDDEPLAWLVDATLPRNIVRTSSRLFIKRFWHIASWIANVRAWLATH